MSCPEGGRAYCAVKAQRTMCSMLHAVYSRTLYCWADLMQPLPYKYWLIVRSHLHCSIESPCNAMEWLNIRPRALPLDEKRTMRTPGLKISTHGDHAMIHGGKMCKASRKSNATYNCEAPVDCRPLLKIKISQRIGYKCTFVTVVNSSCQEHTCVVLVSISD